MKKWKLLSKKDVSPHKWFPIEMRSYELPNGKIVDDFSVTTLADVAMMVTFTPQKKVILVRQYKPGVDEVMLQFPAGRREPHHKDLLDTAVDEMKEETGAIISRQQLFHFATLSGFSTKATERVFVYFGQGINPSKNQKLDETEDIEIVLLDPSELDEHIRNGKIFCAQTIAAWALAKEHFSI
jgi:ADP-ribose pyrophosphatase